MISNNKTKYKRKIQNQTKTKNKKTSQAQIHHLRQLENQRTLDKTFDIECNPLILKLMYVVVRINSI